MSVCRVSKPIAGKHFRLDVKGIVPNDFEGRPCAELTERKKREKYGGSHCVSECRRILAARDHCPNLPWIERMRRVDMGVLFEEGFSCDCTGRGSLSDQFGSVNWTSFSTMSAVRISNP